MHVQDLDITLPTRPRVPISSTRATPVATTTGQASWTAAPLGAPTGGSTASPGTSSNLPGGGSDEEPVPGDGGDGGAKVLSPGVLGGIGGGVGVSFLGIYIYCFVIRRRKQRDPPSIIVLEHKVRCCCLALSCQGCKHVKNKAGATQLTPQSGDCGNGIIMKAFASENLCQLILLLLSLQLRSAMLAFGKLWQSSQDVYSCMHAVL